MVITGDPLAGMVIDCTKPPLVVYSSMKKAVLAVVSPAEPSPERSTARFPRVNAPADALLAQGSAASAASSKEFLTLAPVERRRGTASYERRKKLNVSRLRRARTHGMVFMASVRLLEVRMVFS